ncbi:uncharacterized protein ATC70_008576 [Mucor velutinosus]|uniref:Uncharacterized protein n=1 Tax=Mucor velutinosus TaxID=708070 RepID=A0AAN7DN64_9FUNG|nr:hypothetical protein ATC70_008576 [Mucor velutinosus]
MEDCNLSLLNEPSSFFLLLSTSLAFMVYLNWKESLFVVQVLTFKWYSVQYLLEYLDDLRLHILQQGRARKDLKTPILTSMPLPATEKRRFQGYYVNEAVGDYGYKLDEIRLKFTKLSNNGCHRMPSTSSAELDVLNMIHDMFKAIESKKDIMDQCTFEARYGLMWKTTWQDTQEHDVMACPNIFCHYYKNTVVYVSLLLGKTVCNKKLI